MMPRLRSLVLTAHIASSVGLLGAVATFLVLAFAGLTSHAGPTVQASYLAMELITEFVAVPLCIAALLTGVASSLASPWGLFRHYWVLVKLLLTLVSTVVLLMHVRSIDYLADAAAQTALSDTDLRGMRFQLVIASGAALLVLLVATILSVYKPRGVTRYGWRKQHEQRAVPQA
jgi:hypothetical protein